MKRGKLYTVASGFLMGIAEVIPGVSGGTIAFIAGIYERLLGAIDQVLPTVRFLLRGGNLKEGARRLDLVFLISLLLGMVAGVVIGVLLISRMLDLYPSVVWAFFFGLVLASAFYILSKVNRFSFRGILLLVVSTVLAYALTSLPMGTGVTGYPFIFLSGAIAVSALVLPGISGSFMLLMMGMYTFIVTDTLKGLISQFSLDKLLIMMTFAAGGLVGLFTIAKILTWTFSRYRNLTLLALTGLMLGSLHKIWPWRNGKSWIDTDTGQVVTKLESTTGGDFKLIREVNVWPSDYVGSPHVFWCLVFFVLAVALIWLFARFDRKTR